MLNFDDYAAAIDEPKTARMEQRTNRTSRRRYSERRPCSVSTRQLSRDKRSA